MVETKELVKNAPYFTLGTNWFVFGMNSEAADKIIEMIDNKEFDGYNLAFYLYDIYCKVDDIVSGFNKFIHHLIYKRNWMVNQSISVLCTTQEQRDALGELIEKSSKAIMNLNGEKWPKNDRSFIDMFDWKQDIRTGIPTIKEEPIFESIMTNTELGEPYTEKQLTPVQYAKDTYDEMVYEHQVVNFIMRKDVSKFAGGSTITQRIPGGKVIVDFYHAVTEEPIRKVYTKEELSIADVDTIVAPKVVITVVDL